jgi:hypothetical protein
MGSVPQLAVNKTEIQSALLSGSLPAEFDAIAICAE